MFWAFPTPVQYANSRVFSRNAALIRLAIHKVFLRRIALPCEKKPILLGHTDRFRKSPCETRHGPGGQQNFSTYVLGQNFPDNIAELLYVPFFETPLLTSVTLRYTGIKSVLAVGIFLKTRRC